MHEWVQSSMVYYFHVTTLIQVPSLTPMMTACAHMRDRLLLLINNYGKCSLSSQTKELLKGARV